MVKISTQSGVIHVVLNEEFSVLQGCKSSVYADDTVIFLNSVTYADDTVSFLNSVTYGVEIRKKLTRTVNARL